MTIEVSVRNNNVEKAMRVLKKKLLKDGLMRELRDRQYYSKPSLVKREEKKQRLLERLTVEVFFLIQIMSFFFFAWYSLFLFFSIP